MTDYQELLENMAEQLETLIALCDNNRGIETEDLREQLAEMLSEINAALGYQADEED